MKEGTGRTTQSGHKQEPIPHKVNPAAVAGIGIHSVNRNSMPMYEGRGLKAPMAGTTTHPQGSQGKHK